MENEEQPREKFSATFLGSLLVFFAAVGFSAKAVIIKLAYLQSVDSITLLSLRMAFSLPFFVAMVVVGEMGSKERVSARDALYVVVLGLMGYYLSSLMDFYGLEYVSAGLERLILFLYPTMVVLLSALFFRRKMTRGDGLALILSYGGIAFAVSHDLAERGENTFLGAALIFSCAFTWAVYLIGAERVIARVGSVRFTGYAMVVSTIAVLAHYGASRGDVILRQPRDVYALSLVMAVVSTVVPVLLLSIGMRRIDA